MIEKQVRTKPAEKRQQIFVFWVISMWDLKRKQNNMNFVCIILSFCKQKPMFLAFG
jgi:hypothetical protein